MRLFSILGVPFGFSSSSDESSSFDLVTAGFMPTLEPAQAHLHLDGTDAPALTDLVSRMNFEVISAAPPGYLLHAGALARPDGSTLVLCAAGGSGKTTLTVRLAQRGHAYLSDELAHLDPDAFHLTPYRKPVSIKRGAQPLFPDLAPRDLTTGELVDADAWTVPVTALGGAEVPERSLQPTLVVFPRYDPTTAPAVRRVPRAEATYQLATNSSRAREMHPDLPGAFARLARRLPVYEVVYNDVDDAADVVEDLWTAQ